LCTHTTYHHATSSLLCMHVFFSGVVYCSEVPDQSCCGGDKVALSPSRNCRWAWQNNTYKQNTHCIEHWQFLSRQECRKSLSGNKPWKQEEAHHQKVYWFALPLNAIEYLVIPLVWRCYNQFALWLCWHWACHESCHLTVMLGRWYSVGIKGGGLWRSNFNRNASQGLRGNLQSCVACGISCQVISFAT